MSSVLQPPQLKTHELEDSGAHELDSSDGSEDFVDAPEGDRPPRAGAHSPIPITRVERVDDEAAHGEVPGTKAYNLRTADAVPDEIEVVPEGTRSRSASRASRPATPASPSIPKIIAEKLDPNEPSYGDVPGTAAFELRKADAEPDEIIKSPSTGKPPPNPWKHNTDAEDDDDNDQDEDEDDDDLENLEQGMDDSSGARGTKQANNDFDEYDEHEDDDDGGGFGDDFDDFAEGQEVEAGDDDFGDFGEPSLPTPAPQPQPPSPSNFPVPDFTKASDLSDVQQTCAPYLRALFPTYSPDTPSDLPPPTQQIFLSDRSISLYTQLIAPPPLAPPNWLRSRIRRLFLVSLGVPVDLDEILPASKQKKLVLPSGLLKSRDLDGSKSPLPSTLDEKSALNRLKSSGNDSDNSVNTTASGSRKARKSKTSSSRDTDPIPEFDVSAARRLAQTTQERMDGMDDEEIRKHVEELQSVSANGRLYLGYWERKIGEAGKEKEAFEGVIENLVSFARKVRK